MGRYDLFIGMSWGSLSRSYWLPVISHRRLFWAKAFIHFLQARRLFIQIVHFSSFVRRPDIDILVNVYFINFQRFIIFAGKLFDVCAFQLWSRNWNISRPFSVLFIRFNRSYIDQNEMRPEKIPKKLYIKSWRPKTIGRFMAYLVIRRPFIADARVWSQSSSCRFCTGKSANMTGFTPSPSVFPFQHHDINTAY